VVFKLDGTEIHVVVVLTEAHTSRNKVRVRSGDFILNVDEKQIARHEQRLSSNIHKENAVFNDAVGCRIFRLFYLTRGGLLATTEPRETGDLK
jgi:hypothetical protein